MTASTPREFRLDELLGREVRTADGAPIGRLEELRCAGETPYDVTEYVIGLAGLFERLHIVRTILGLKPRGFIATTRQLDLSEPTKPVLTCERSKLRRL